MKRHAWKYERWDYEPDTSRSPKRWTRPRSRAWREAQSAPIPKATLESTTKILKRYWNDRPGPIWGKPEWAKVAQKFGWMTRNEFWAVPEIQVGWFKGIDALLYEASPLFGMLKKGA